MTRKDAIEVLGYIKAHVIADGFEEALDMAIEALSKPNYESDTEVRLAVTDRNKDKVVLWDAFGEVEYYPTTHGRLIDADALYASIAKDTYLLTDRINSRDYGMFLVGIKQKIDEAPTVQADRPHGEWVKQNNELKISEYKCSECGYYQDDKTNFCPNCGADNRGGEDECL